MGRLNSSCHLVRDILLFDSHSSISQSYMFKFEVLVQIPFDLFIYSGFCGAFNTVQVISRWVVGRAEETSTYSSSGFCTVNCRSTASNYQLYHLRLCWEPNPGLRGGRWECRLPLNNWVNRFSEGEGTEVSRTKTLLGYRTKAFGASSGLSRLPCTCGSWFCWLLCPQGTLWEGI